MAIKAPLKIVLHAGDTIVAESDDANLWHRLLAALTESPPTPAVANPPPPKDAGADRSAAEPERSDDAMQRFADDLGLSRHAIRRACAPSTEPPYLHLDRAAWEAMKRGTPPRGPGSVPRAAVAATLLVLWFRCADLGSPTMKMVHQALRAIDLRDKNAVRVVDEAEWLHRRGAAIGLNAARASRAVALAQAFCARDWTSYRAAQ